MTLREALTRFTAEVAGLLSERRGPVAVVSHGRVICLYLESRTQVDPFEMWRRLTLPSFVVLDLDHRRIEHLAVPV